MKDRGLELLHMLMPATLLTLVFAVAARVIG